MSDEFNNLIIHVHLQVPEKSLKAIEIKLEEQSKTIVELKGKLLELKLNDSIKTEDNFKLMQDK